MKFLHQDEHHNGWVFTICYIFIFLAAPVVYVGIVQAALFDKLGASKTLANLPASTYLLGQIAPLFFSWLVPYRLERNMVVWANLATASFSTMVFLTLALPAPTEVRIAAVVLQGLLQGLSASTSFVFMQQCLRRGCSEAGVARTLQRTFSMTPFAAVAGSLGAQYLLNPGLPAFPFPYDFALIYLIAIPCSIAIALNARRFRLTEIPERKREPFFAFLLESARSYFRQPRLATTWIAYVLWYVSLGIASNLALYAKEAMHRDPADFSGWTMAIRFGGKAAGGFLLGWLAVRFGLRGGALGCIALLAFASAWAWATPGIVYLFAFALIGAGELGGAYLPNYVGSLSPPSESTRNFAIITLATPFSSFAPVLHGALTDHYGFPASFAFSFLTALLALALVAFQARPSPHSRN
jgi:MFS family permease